MQELSKKEIDEVNGGLVNAAIGAGIGAVWGGVNAAMNGKSIAGGVFGGAVTGLSFGVGAGLIGTGLSIGGRVYRSATAGISSIGIGSAFSGASIFGGSHGRRPFSRR